MTIQEAAARIRPPDGKAMEEAGRRLDTRAKLPGSLGGLETAVRRLAGIQRTASPRLNAKLVAVFCADNGVIAADVSPSDPAVTAQQAVNFTRGGGTVNAFARRLGASVRVIDVGIATPYVCPQVERRAVMPGTRNMTVGPAMTADECRAAVEIGLSVAQEAARNGADLLIPGEMGIGNTTSSSAVTALLLGLPPEQVAAKGAGSPARTAHKAAVIREAIAVNQPRADDPLDVIAKVGGLDIAAMCGAFLGGAACGLAVMTDGIISCAAALAAARLAPGVGAYLLPSHCSAESAGSLLLDALGLSPLITGGLCLGEGTGAILGAALLDYALAAYYETADIASLATLL